MTPIEKVLLAANDRFLDYMRERQHASEESVLGDVMGHTSAGQLIRAIAEWRISQRSPTTSSGEHSNDR